MMVAPKDGVRALLRGARSGLRHFEAALDCRREHGLSGVLARVADRLLRADPAADLLANEARPAPGTVFDVIYAIGYWHGEPKRYRVFNMAEGLRAAGYAVHIMPFERIADMVRERWRAAALVLFRAEYDRLVGIAEALAYARSAGMRVVYDIDDLVFDTEIAERIDGLQLMGRHQRREYIASMVRRRRLLLACDGATVSTVPLARAVAALGQSSSVVANSLNAEQLRLADELAAQKRATDGQLRIGYFSGSRTHQRDFAVCEAALLDFMRSHDQAIFRLVGYLDLGPQWEVFAKRIERIEFVPPDPLLRLIAECDINLAPLELGNPFCEAKSELKFFEAAVVSVPTIASATEPLAAAIEQGVSGFVASDDGGWGQALHLLAASASRREAMGQAARTRALAHHSLTAVIPQAVRALGLASPAAPNRTAVAPG
jgi:glycosyltransferase involved in cell wall biosynthesis